MVSRRSKLIILLLIVLGSLAAEAVDCRRLFAESRRQNGPIPITLRKPISIERRELSDLADDGKIYLNIQANSDQRQPLYLGSSPREMELTGARAQVSRLPQEIKPLAESQVQATLQKLQLKKAEFEIWPVRDEYGRLTWVLARYRTSSTQPWTWLNESLIAKEIRKSHPNRDPEPLPILPRFIRPSTARGESALFRDFLELGNLYDKPRFSNVIWLKKDSGEALGAWLPSEELKLQRAALEKNSAEAKNLLAIELPQPPRLNNSPVVFHLEVKETGAVNWLERVDWFRPDVVDPSRVGQVPSLLPWRSDFVDQYREDVLQLAGEKPLEFPDGQRKVVLKRKSSADPKNQIGVIVDFLEARYKKLGIRTRRQTFMWRGIEQANLIAVIPGRLPRGQNRPVLIADHIDTAFMEDVYDKTGQRVSAHGANDNVTAVAALLRAAEALKDSNPEHDIWLVHLTGEEFPADDLGARRFIEDLLEKKQDISGLLLMDMIGYNPNHEKFFQVNYGQTSGSSEMAAVAVQAAATAAPEREPILRGPNDMRSYLYNTDGLVFDENGFPVVFFNEVMNRTMLASRTGYHDTLDVSQNIDFDFAASIVKTVITTAHTMSHSSNPAK